MSPSISHRPSEQTAAATTTAAAADGEKTVWYLAYGSNMEPKVLTGRRKIKPIESVPVIVPGYWLSFDIGGIPFVEPCFASILKMDPARMHDKAYAQEVFVRTQYGREFLWDERHPDHPARSYPPVLQGVAHKITLRDWQLVIQSEGGWGHDVPTGYNQIEVDCRVVGTNEHITTHVLEARPLSVKSHCQPSARYKALLVSGAAYHNLDPAYQQYLSTIVPYECTGARSKIARVLFVFINFPTLLLFAFRFWTNKGKSADQLQRPPYWQAWFFDKAARFSSTAHDYVIAPILGSGRSSSLVQQAVIRERIQKSMQVSETPQEYQANMEADLDRESSALKMAEQAAETVAE
ncbi:hypothetical protein BX616_000009 [Lobosporangium transversale]|uniref:gamma-glutamylcyclotransferase n=1 Tax=Lobosporangium transversale TaxID=64571 RepID=A0A1Y2GAB5_9FUNG|nr:hypothetical protein BCR41DRAFT_389893 [Lobosporangium transversale]KAF9919398.1 hypothetical protein BX616_000009 [Lobosporangium transversale]ORZ04530.1 hypothetical protein BCR41DRAFT_389893 [Lobosporangium transversale]|eukprot:XP_021876576.1 hypothetical protein BCR41DRAFT_389893 [Lobosporangium transversale]